MKRVNAKKRIVIFLVIFMAFAINSYARYFKSINVEYQGQIAEPIIKVQGITGKTSNNDYNRNTGELEYFFNIKNYEIEDNGSKRITEVDFNYEIYLEETNHNFPIKYELYDMSTGEELLNGENKTLPKHIHRNKEFIQNYKLVVKWDESKHLEGNKDMIDIKVKVMQSAKGELL
ncbi:MAG: hypothetical protein K6D97_05975 [Clostridia bacterium]|nr:hypothetical protein [Clostridia bacterium]